MQRAAHANGWNLFSSVFYLFVRLQRCKSFAGAPPSNYMSEVYPSEFDWPYERYSSTSGNETIYLDGHILFLDE